MSGVIQKKRRREKDAKQKQECRKDPEFLEKEKKKTGKGGKGEKLREVGGRRLYFTSKRGHWWQKGK